MSASHSFLCKLSTKNVHFAVRLQCLPRYFVYMYYKSRPDWRCIPEHDLLFSEKVPVTLMNRYLDKGHRLFLDNYYMSPSLAQYLLHCQTKVVATVRPTRRNFPRELAAAGIDKGESKFLVAHTGMLAVKFHAYKISPTRNRRLFTC